MSIQKWRDISHHLSIFVTPIIPQSLNIASLKPKLSQKTAQRRGGDKWYCFILLHLADVIIKSGFYI